MKVIPLSDYYAKVKKEENGVKRIAKAIQLLYKEHKVTHNIEVKGETYFVVKE